DNFIKTSKYSLLTFVPVNLFQQFTRIANFYFLVLLCLQCIPQISSVNWVYTLVPLSFVLLCSAIKDGYDDLRSGLASLSRHNLSAEAENYILLLYQIPHAIDILDRIITRNVTRNGCELQRHRNDRIVNQRVAYVLRYNTKRGKIDICEEEWMNVKVGDIVRMESGDFIAADLLLLSTSDSGICYIETAELDGETNLKTRMALPCTTEMGDIIDKIYEFDGLIVCEPPNNRLDQFNGRLEWLGQKYNLDNNNMLLRGCCLRNTRFCYGVVVFAGADTKLMQNSGESPLKRTSLDKFLNILILGIVLFLFVCTLICTLMTGFWEQIVGRHFRVFLPWDEIVPRIKNLTTVQLPVVQGVTSFLGDDSGAEERAIAPSQVLFIVALQFFSYIILLNTVVPISLYISVEMIRLAHSKFINSDLKMYDPKTDTPANARTSTLNEELGQVQYVFSDKTGTLTQNVM
uniref:P-type ATPase N-terminal domain-containing protein n=1 Tax=Meloidogyne incognita TaxID=6306 RepID=A0A914NM72_MELIC